MYVCVCVCLSLSLSRSLVSPNRPRHATARACSAAAAPLFGVAVPPMELETAAKSGGKRFHRKDRFEKRHFQASRRVCLNLHRREVREALVHNRPSPLSVPVFRCSVPASGSPERSSSRAPGIRCLVLGVTWNCNCTCFGKLQDTFLWK